MIKLASLLMCTLFSLPSIAEKEINASHIKGYDFSIRDVQSYCTAKRESGESLSINCKKKRLKPVAQACEGLISGGLDLAKLNCGGGLWVLNKVCKIEMRGASRGDVNCVF